MTSINLSEHTHLPERLTIDFSPGHISLGKNRMILLHTSAMASLRKELIDTLGITRARGVLTRMGYESGKKDAQLAKELMPNATDEELLKVGPSLHSVEGIVKVTALKLNIDISQGIFMGDFLWEDSYEAEIHLDTYGMETESVCWTQIGYATGYTSAIMGRFILYREVECCGKGDRHCRDIGKPKEQWDNAEDDLKYFEPDHVVDQLIHLQTEVEHLRLSLEDDTTLVKGMIGESEAFRKSYKLLHKAADSDITVLLLGETGVGKEVFSRQLHDISPRANKNFVSVNCAAIPENLIESELFGVEKGAYTGAQQSRPGRFERAHGGTLFLDEVGELSLSAQAKLLRVLQEGEFERLGDIRVRKVNVRLITATNVDLKKAVDDGHFRADLFYRLNIYPIVIPALRQRRNDIPLLVRHFLDKYAALYSKKINTISDGALKVLCNYSWPGNIRELEHIIERGVIIANTGESITVDNLFPRFEVDTITPESPEKTTDSLIPKSDGSLKSIIEKLLNQPQSLEDIELIILETAVIKCNGNLSAAARLLGITRAQLAYRLKARASDI
jgi:two-component system response regulator HydG